MKKDKRKKREKRKKKEAALKRASTPKNTDHETANIYRKIKRMPKKLGENINIKTVQEYNSLKKHVPHEQKTIHGNEPEGEIELEIDMSDFGFKVNGDSDE